MEEEKSKTIPAVPAKVMEAGPNGTNLAAQSQAPHPIDVLQQTGASGNPYQDLRFVRHVYGSGLAMRLATERKLAAQEKRQTGGLPCAGIYGDVTSGKDVQLDFTDYLNLPEYRPVQPKSGTPHATMERQLGMM